MLLGTAVPVATTEEGTLETLGRTTDAVAVPVAGFGVDTFVVKVVPGVPAPGKVKAGRVKAGGVKAGRVKAGRVNGRLN